MSFIYRSLPIDSLLSHSCTYLIVSSQYFLRVPHLSQGREMERCLLGRFSTLFIVDKTTAFAYRVEQRSEGSGKEAVKRKFNELYVDSAVLS